MPSLIETRIINIQKKLSIAESGIFDIQTCKAIEKLKGIIAPNNGVLIDHKKAIIENRAISEQLYASYPKRRKYDCVEKIAGLDC